MSGVILAVAHYLAGSGSRPVAGLRAGSRRVTVLGAVAARVAVIGLLPVARLLAVIGLLPVAGPGLVAGPGRVTRSLVVGGWLALVVAHRLG